MLASVLFEFLNLESTYHKYHMYEMYHAYHDKADVQRFSDN